MSKPTIAHLEVAKRILRYIHGILHHGISFTPGPLTLMAFSNANWVGDPIDHRSTTSLHVFLGPCPVSYLAKKQAMVARSSTEAKCRALATITTELSWLHMTLSLSFGVTMSQPLNSLLVLCFILTQSISRLIIIMFVRRCCVMILCVLTDLFIKPLPSPSFLLQRHKHLLDSSLSRLRGDVDYSDNSRTKNKNKMLKEEVG